MSARASICDVGVELVFVPGPALRARVPTKSLLTEELKAVSVGPRQRGEIGDFENAGGRVPLREPRVPRHWTLKSYLDP
jgi:hypothetical protein